MDVPRPDPSRNAVNLESVPLFMKSLPEESSEDATINALQSLLYEGTPDEVAENFKDQGNEAYKEKRYRDALSFYTQGIAAKPDNHALLEVLHSNRAASNLPLENYGSVLRDCAVALSLNPQSSKALFRSATALEALQRYEEALDCCQRCLAFDPENPSIRTLLAKAQKLKAAKDAKQAILDARVKADKGHSARVARALKERALVVVPVDASSQSELPPIQFESETDESDGVIFPVFLLYPQYATSDLISGFHEDTTFAEQLGAMFPPTAPRAEWDAQGNYTVENIAVYGITHRQRLFKVGKNMTLRDAIAAPRKLSGAAAASDGLEVKEGCLSFIIVSRGDVEKNWVTEHKKKQMREM